MFRPLMLMSGVALSLALVALAPSTAVAQDEDPAKAFAALATLCDANGDKVVTFAEYKTVAVAYREAMEKAMADVQAAMEAEKKFAGLISLESYLMADNNDDQKLTSEEYALYHARTFTKHAQGPPTMSDADDRAMAAFEADMLFRQLAPFDADKDGKISRAEMAAYILAMIKKERAARDADPMRPRLVEPDGPEDDE